MPESPVAGLDHTGLPEGPQPEHLHRLSAGYRENMLGGDYGAANAGSTAWGDEDKAPVPANITEDCTKESLPPLCEHELEFSVKDATSYSVGASTRSQSLVVGNFRFKILVFPAGTHSTQGNQVSAFIEADPIEGLDPKWIFHGVKYQITVINWLDYRNSVTKVDTWTFSKDGIDRGWHDMVRTADLSQKTGWLGPDNSLYLRACCYARQADSINVNNDYNVRKETGFIGLKNHGATCYMNGLLQSLFHVGEFRRIVYAIECDDGADAGPCKGDLEGMSPEDLASSIAHLKAFINKGEGTKEALHDSATKLQQLQHFQTYGHSPSKGSPSKADNKDEDGGALPSLIQSLQNVFYKLQTSDVAVNCRELMKSFGWDTMDAFTQHDAQELNRILCDRLEEQMKGSPMDGSIKKLFEGEMENYIECIDVGYKSKRNETFYDIQLNIKSESGRDLQNIQESMRDFTAEETLEGDNAYEAEGHGKQRAKKGIRFLSFPPVLNLQLKRFHFDLEKMDMVKLNTKFEFNRMLDLSAFAPGAGRYMLHAVVVHSGDVNSGHYYVHIKPSLDSDWFKFDDDTVTPCSEYAAVEDNYGGSDPMVWNYFDKTPKDLYVSRAQPPSRPRIHNAYMLVYIREDCAARVLEIPDPVQVNERMVQRCDRDVLLAEQRRREKMEQQMKIKIKFVFEKDLCKMQGFWDHQEIVSTNLLKMGRDQKVADLLPEAETIMGIPQQYLAFFTLTSRNNPRQVRFDFMSQTAEFRTIIPQFNAAHFDQSDPYLVVLCIAARGYDFQTWKLSDPTAKELPDELQRWNDENVYMLVVKYFCPVNRKIFTLGCHYMPHSELLVSMVDSGWVQQRIAPYLESKDVAPLPEGEDLVWECWEEFSERDIQMRNVRRSVKCEQLWSGDVIIWQPAKASTPGADEAPPASGDDDVAPAYPVNNVMDLALHQMNSVDVTVTLHDSKQPLCVEGIVSNGQWGPPRATGAALKIEPKKAEDDKAGKEDNAEQLAVEAALSQSLASFQMPQEKEIKMDLRWRLQYVTGAIARAFGLGPQGGESRLWLFHAAPSCSYQEPLNTHMMRSEQTLKDLQRNSLYTSPPQKKSLTLHAVELPFQPGRQVFERNMCPFCVRFYDSAVRELGSAIVTVPNSATAAEVLAEAKHQLRPEWGIDGPLRLIEVSESRLHKIHAPDVPVSQFLCFNKSNIFFHSLRVEPEDAEPSDLKLVEISHCDRQSQQAFAQPFLLALTPGEKAGAIKLRCKAKLQVAEGEFKSWRLVRPCRSRKTHLKDDEAWDAESPLENNLCLEHVHPNPTSNLVRQSRYNKPLTIRP